jgi:hypothetical protein
MDELIYLIVKLIVGLITDSKAKQQAVRPADQALQQRIWEQQRLMQQAALAARAKPVTAPPPLPPRAAPVRPAQPVAANWVDTERASRHDAGGKRSSELTRLLQTGSLRRQFILTELLRPPVSLRPPRI